jgi:hypothetical protein
LLARTCLAERKMTFIDLVPAGTGLCADEPFDDAKGSVSDPLFDDFCKCLKGKVFPDAAKRQSPALRELSGELASDKTLVG